MCNTSTMERSEQPPVKEDGQARGAPARRRNETNKGSELEVPREVDALDKYAAEN